MASLWKFVSPTAFVGDLSSQWTIGRKSSGVVALERTAALGADTSVILTCPLPAPVEETGVGPYLDAIYLHHFISATSAGVTPIISASFRVWEVEHSNGIVWVGGMAALASAAMAEQLNSETSAGYIQAADISGADFTPKVLSAAGVAIASLWTSSQLEKFSNIQRPTRSGAPFTQDYVPRLSQRSLAVEISASVGASAVWEIYGLLLEYKARSGIKP